MIIKKKTPVKVSIPVWRIYLWSVDFQILEFVSKKILNTAKSSSLKVSVVHLPKKRKLCTVMQSIFIYKNHMDHLGMEIFKVLITVTPPAGVTIDDVFKDIIIPSGVEIKVSFGEK